MLVRGRESNIFLAELEASELQSKPLNTCRELWRHSAIKICRILVAAENEQVR
ncbi:unnamed protein product [Ectocarpus sp. 6 AP-2014]